MSFNFYDEVVDLFQNNYTLDYPVAFDDMSTYDFNTSSYVQQPTDNPWLRVNSDSGAVIQETIGTKSTIRKNEICSVIVQIFLPRSSGGGTAYTTKNFAETINHLDSFLMFDSIKTIDDALITMGQPPKITNRSPPSPGDTWQQVNVTYNLNYRYI